jgi:hypothetical protein
LSNIKLFAFLNCFIPRYKRYKAPIIFTLINSIDEVVSIMPSPDIEIADSIKSPIILANDDIVTVFISCVKPFDIAKNIAGPGLII